MLSNLCFVISKFLLKFLLVSLHNQKSILDIIQSRSSLWLSLLSPSADKLVLLLGCIIPCVVSIFRRCRKSICHWINRIASRLLCKIWLWQTRVFIRLLMVRRRHKRLLVHVVSSLEMLVLWTLQTRCLDCIMGLSWSHWWVDQLWIVAVSRRSWPLRWLWSIVLKMPSLLKWWFPLSLLALMNVAVVALSASWSLQILVRLVICLLIWTVYWGLFLSLNAWLLILGTYGWPATVTRIRETSRSPGANLSLLIISENLRSRLHWRTKMLLLSFLVSPLCLLLYQFLLSTPQVILSLI